MNLGVSTTLISGDEDTLQQYVQSVAEISYFYSPLSHVAICPHIDPQESQPVNSH